MRHWVVSLAWIFSDDINCILLELYTNIFETIKIIDILLLVNWLIDVLDDWCLETLVMLILQKARLHILNM